MHQRLNCVLIGGLLTSILVAVVAIITYIQWAGDTNAVVDYQRLFLQLINGYRVKHHVNPLYPSVELNRRALECAQFYALKGDTTIGCPYKPANTTEAIYERNDSKSSLSVVNEDVIRETLEDWYSQESVYDYNSYQFQNSSAHFAQMVWRSTKNVGFGIGKHSNMIVSCALYSPTVEVDKSWQDNVLRP